MALLSAHCSSGLLASAAILQTPCRFFCGHCFAQEWLFLHTFDGCQHFGNSSWKLSGVVLGKLGPFDADALGNWFPYTVVDDHVVCCKIFHGFVSRIVLMLLQSTCLSCTTFGFVGLAWLLPYTCQTEQSWLQSPHAAWGCEA